MSGEQQVIRSMWTWGENKTQISHGDDSEEKHVKYPLHMKIYWFDFVLESPWCIRYGHCVLLIKMKSISNKNKLSSVFIFISFAFGNTVFHGIVKMLDSKSGPALPGCSCWVSVAWTCIHGRPDEPGDSASGKTNRTQASTIVSGIDCKQ